MQAPLTTPDFGTVLRRLAAAYAECVDNPVAQRHQVARGLVHAYHEARQVILAQTETHEVLVSLDSRRSTRIIVQSADGQRHRQVPP